MHMKLENMFHCAEPEVIEEYSRFVFTNERDKDCYQDVWHKFEELCQGARNVIYERLVLNQPNQKEGENRKDCR